MEKSKSNLIFLSVGLTLGAAVGYVLASDKLKRKEWLKSATDLAGKIKGAVHKQESNIDLDTVEDDGEEH